ncbi:WAS/WASL-interacting protein family member 1-like isoform X2 [Ostrea edulis]|uniref:WAS/WASL-interacting protein family member 1-like isoform X2 n=1 Tax=Ostrea edulis TaxID=37623 RepID=UPI0020944045|nr:WAS/WASL-interacting protein family member 1-like isoform X2 [Ostrea edulis]
MAALAMSGAPPPLPSRSGRPEPPAVRTLPRRSSTSIDRLQPPQYPRNRRQSDGELPPPPPRNRRDPLPPVPPSIGSLPNPPANQQRQSSPYSSQTLPRNSRSDSSLQNQVAAPPVLPPRRGASLHGAHSPSTRPHLMNGSYPTPIQESDDLESRFHFHDVNDLPQPPEFKDARKKYSSEEFERHRRKGGSPEM